MSHTITLESPQQAHEVWTRAWQWVKGRTLQGRRVTLTLQDETRSLSQNDHFHALCEDIAKSDLQWFGKRRTKNEWKVLLVSGHAVATNLPGEVVPGIEGEFVSIRESTAQMSKARSASLIDYTLKFCAEKGVKVRHPEEQA